VSSISGKSKEIHVHAPGRKRTRDSCVRPQRSAALITSSRSNYVGYEAKIMLKLTSMPTAAGCGRESVVCSCEHGIELKLGCLYPVACIRSGSGVSV
jgi:hypothetical protein